MTRLYSFYLSFTILLSSFSCGAQSFLDKLTDIFEFEIHNQKRDSADYITKVVLAPTISYRPVTSLSLGIGSKFLFKPKGAREETRTSNIPISVAYTLKNQFIFGSSYEVFFLREKWLLKGNLGFSRFPITYFGVGRASREADKVELSFNQLLIEPLLLRRVVDNFFIGGGFRYYNTYNAGLGEGEENNDGRYSGLIDSLNASSVGLELAITLDSRNNVLNPTEGDFLEFTQGFYDKVLGGTNRFMLSKANYRKYIRTNPEKLNVIAFELFTRLSWGEPSLLELSALGGDRLLRGFQEGRFRDRFAYFSQTEYRWQTFKKIGFVFF
ncbi:MAG: BamA/TamA family outer membrane protein, partial [Bacteroidota bacterium]